MGNTCNFNVESSKVGETQFEVTGKDNKTYYMIRKKDVKLIFKFFFSLLMILEMRKQNLFMIKQYLMI